MDKRTRLVRVFAFLDQPEGVRVYPPEIRQVILDRIAAGESLRRVCERDDMPGMSVVMEWLQADEEFRSKYARAREDQADGIFETMADIESSVEAGDLKPDAARVILESRRWRAEKLKPKVYGAKVAHTGADGGPLIVQVNKLT